MVPLLDVQNVNLYASMVHVKMVVVVQIIGVHINVTVLNLGEEKTVVIVSKIFLVKCNNIFYKFSIICIDINMKLLLV